MSDITEDLLKLAEDLGINLESQSQLLESGSAYTKYPIPDGVATVRDAYKTEQIEWNIPGQGPEFKEAFYINLGGERIQFGPPQEIGGIIVGYFQKNQFAYYDGENFNSICSVTGYNDPERGLVKGLPNVPCKNIYSWGADKKIDRYTPDPMIIKQGLVGSRGMSCEECIKGGMSFQEVELAGADGKTQTKMVECEPRGNLLMAVTEITKITKKPNPVKGGDPIEEKNSKSIFDLLDENGEPHTKPRLIVIPMSKSFIRGAYKAGVNGYAGYVMDLEKRYRNSPQRNPIFNFTTLRLVKPPEGRVYQPHFQSMGIPSTEEIKTALSLYERPNFGLMPGATQVKELKAAPIQNVPSDEEVPW